MVIRLDRVGKRYQDGKEERWVLRDLSFAVQRGESVAVEGPSGSGKTTLLNVLAGLVQVDAGDIDVTLNDEKVLSLRDLSHAELARFRRFDIGFIYQFFNLVPTLTLEENVLLPIELTGRKHMTDQALARIDALGLDARRHAFPDELSGGEQQRAAIARALAHGPSIVFADEPTGNLDSKNSKAVADLLWQEVQTAGVTLIVASHSDELMQKADRVINL